MSKAIQPEMLVQLAKRVRATLQVADAFELDLVAIHLDAALAVLSSCEGTGAIELEPYSLRPLALTGSALAGAQDANESRPRALQR